MGRRCEPPCPGTFVRLFSCVFSPGEGVNADPPTTSNFAAECPAFREITGLSADGAWGMSLALGKPPWWSWHLPCQLSILSHVLISDFHEPDQCAWCCCPNLKNVFSVPPSTVLVRLNTYTEKNGTWSLSPTPHKAELNIRPGALDLTEEKVRNMLELIGTESLSGQDSNSTGSSDQPFSTWRVAQYWWPVQRTDVHSEYSHKNSQLSVASVLGDSTPSSGLF